MNKKSNRLKSVRAAAKQSRLDKTSVRALHCILIQSVSLLRFTIAVVSQLSQSEHPHYNVFITQVKPSALCCNVTVSITHTVALQLKNWPPLIQIYNLMLSFPKKLKQEIKNNLWTVFLTVVHISLWFLRCPFSTCHNIKHLAVKKIFSSYFTSNTSTVTTSLWRTY